MNVKWAGRLFDVQMPMAVAFGHARASRSVARNLVVSFTLDGVTGLGEGVAREYVTGETPDSAFEALRQLDLEVVAHALHGRTLEEALARLTELDLPERLRQGAVPGQAAACAVELAAVDWLARREGVPLSALASRLSLPAGVLHATPPASHPVSGVYDFGKQLSDVAGPDAPPAHVKLKLGKGLSEDVERARAARAALGPHVRLSVDANMAWSLEEAVERVAALKAFDIAWYEEPLPQRALEDCRQLRERSGTKVMLDESLCTEADGQAAIAQRACDAFNLRLSKCGGFVPSLRLAALARTHGLGVQLGCQVGEFAVLAAAARHFAGAVQGLLAYEGGHFEGRFATSIVQERLPSDRRAHTAPMLSAPGLGLTLDEAAVEAHTLRQVRWGLS